MKMYTLFLCAVRAYKFFDCKKEKKKQDKKKLGKLKKGMNPLWLQIVSAFTQDNWIRSNDLAKVTKFHLNLHLFEVIKTMETA